MKLVIGGYEVESDGACVTLSHIRVWKPGSKDAGQEYRIPIGYYPNFEQALHRLLQEKISEGDRINADEMLLRIGAAKSEIIAAIAGAKELWGCVA